MAAAAEKLASDYAGWNGSAAPDELDLCSVYKGEDGLSDARIRVGLDDGKFIDSDDHAPTLHPYAMGRKALAGARRSYLHFECVSPRMDGSDKKPALIRGEMFNRNVPEEGSVALREASLVALHSAALALAKELGCKDNGSLAEKATLKPVA
ncbi:hypothetical protein [Streptomyces sp. NPDC051219]|uniref:hypothetical protein n=1 Tax=Streptomyces sp. NPDC051219 TaxID=3155283 RepID=UPI00344AE02D